MSTFNYKGTEIESQHFDPKSNLHSAIHLGSTMWWPDKHFEPNYKSSQKYHPDTLDTLLLSQYFEQGFRELARIRKSWVAWDFRVIESGGNYLIFPATIKLPYFRNFLVAVPKPSIEVAPHYIKRYADAIGKAMDESMLGQWKKL